MHQETYLAKLLTDPLIHPAHLSNKGDACEEDTMVSVPEKGFGFASEVIHEVGNTSDYPEGTEGGLKSAM